MAAPPWAVSPDDVTISTPATAVARLPRDQLRRVGDVGEAVEGRTARS